jgi:signal transduction histidine kinase
MQTAARGFPEDHLGQSMKRNLQHMDSSQEGWPSRRGQMAHLIRSFDWTQTSLGPIENWPPSVRSYVDVVLNCGFPATLQWGPELTLIYNDAYIPIIGSRHPTALGHPILETFPEIRETYEPILKRLWNGESVMMEDLRFTYIRENEPEDTWFTMSYSPVGGDGQVSGVIALGVEMTARHKAERQSEDLRIELERSNEELSRFSYALAHDLQAPVRTVRAMTELLARDGQGNLSEKQKSLVDMTIEAAEGMQRLVASMLEFAQVGQGEVKRLPVAVREVVEAVLLKLRACVTESHAKITLGPLPEVEADRIQLEQLFQNLIANAIQYRQPGRVPVIRICGAPIDGGWTFAVQDDGMGVPMEAHQLIFEPLKRLRGADSPGTGLGLTLCRKIVERHGGKIWVESAGEAQGSVFRFTLCKITPHPTRLEIPKFS